MPQTNTPPLVRPSWRDDGFLSLWGRVRYRQPAEYDAWLHERDMTIITATLMRLTERQLNRLGMSHKTLALDVEDLALQAERNARISKEVLELVHDEAPQQSEPRDQQGQSAIAAE
ncbi:MAG: hypothetical protein IIX61_08905 [Loktanella sp.]|nr:hypothetical protein [Loktanella sp.]